MSSPSGLPRHHVLRLHKLDKECVMPTFSAYPVITTHTYEPQFRVEFKWTIQSSPTGVNSRANTYQNGHSIHDWQDWGCVCVILCFLWCFHDSLKILRLLQSMGVPSVTSNERVLAYYGRRPITRVATATYWVKKTISFFEMPQILSVTTLKCLLRQNRGCQKVNH